MSKQRFDYRCVWNDGSVGHLEILVDDYTAVNGSQARAIAQRLFRERTGKNLPRKGHVWVEKLDPVQQAQLSLPLEARAT